MFIGDLLIAHGLVTTADVNAALDHQKVHGGRLGESLVVLGKLRAADLEAVLQSAPPVPNSVEDTGLQLSDLLNLLTKILYTSSAETPSAIPVISRRYSSGTFGQTKRIASALWVSKEDSLPVS